MTGFNDFRPALFAISGLPVISGLMKDDAQEEILKCVLNTIDGQSGTIPHDIALT